MYFLDNNSGIATMPPLSAAQSTTPRWFSEGDGAKGISWPGQDWFNIVQAELLAILNVAGLRPDKSKLNQLALAIKVIVGNEALLKNNCLSEIAQAGAAAQKKARDALGLGALATKDSLGPVDVNALAKNQNLKDVPSKAEARKALELGNSATRNVGTTSGTVAAGDDGRITGSMQKNQNGADIPDKARFINNLGLRGTVDQAAGALQRSGGTVSGDINFDRDTWLGWNRNTDYAKIGFKNEADSDTDSYLWFEVGDNGNEYFKWRRNRGGPKLDLMNLKEDGLSVFVDAYFKSLGIDSQSGSWISMRDHRSVFTRNAVTDNSAQAILRQDHSDKKFFVGGLGGQQFGFYMIKNDRTSNGYDAGAFLNKEGDWCCNGKIIPTNYSNFDERYVKDIRLSTREGSQVWNGRGYGDQPPYVITGVLNSNRDEFPDTIYRRALQKFINGTWYNIGGL